MLSPAVMSLCAEQPCGPSAVLWGLVSPCLPSRLPVSSSLSSWEKEPFDAGQTKGSLGEWSS